MLLKKRMVFVLAGCLSAASMCGQDDTISTIKISKPTVKKSFSILMQTGETWFYKVTQDSIMVIYECTPTKSKAETVYKKRLSQIQASGFYDMLAGLRIDTLKDRYDYIAPVCDDCQSYYLFNIAGNSLPTKQVSQFNGMHPGIRIISKQINALIRKTNYKIRYPGYYAGKDVPE